MPALGEAVLAEHDLVTIEDDGIGHLSGGAVESLAARRPDLRRVFVRSYSKSHGPDLRIAVVEGSDREIAQMHGFAEFGSRWTSRLLQDALASMLTDPATWAGVEEARAEYARRGEAFLDRYELHSSACGQGLLDLWLRVADERRAVVTLAARGVSCLGSPKFFLEPATEHVRISTSRLREEDWAVLDRAVPHVQFSPAATRP